MLHRPPRFALPAYTVYLLMTGVSALFFALWGTVTGVYRIESAGLNPFELVMVGTVLEGSVFLCEVPTGVVADVYSRKLSIVIGIALMGCGFVLEGSFTLFTTILIAQVLWGVGYTFTSGAEAAWIADEIGEGRAARAFMRGAQAGHLGALLGILASVSLATYKLNLPMLLGGALMVALAVALLAIMPERNFSPAPPSERGSLATMGLTLRTGLSVVRGRPVFVSILAIGAIGGAASEAFDRLWQAHFLKHTGFPVLGDLEPIVWFGIINVSAMALSFLAVEISRRQVDAESQRGAAGALLLINLLLVAAMLGFALSGSFGLAAGTYLSAVLLRNVNDPIYTAWVNQGLDPGVRATVLSMSSQANAFGQIAGGPLIGAVGTLLSIRAALVTSSVALTPILLLCARALERGRLDGRADQPVAEPSSAAPTEHADELPA